MNTLRRISRYSVKAVAAGAVLVAAAVPVALAGTAGAATGPTITCDVASLAPIAPAYCSTGYAIVGQGFAGNFYVTGTGFANDQPIGGNVTLTTTAPGVTFTNVTEISATNLHASISTTAATTPGFYPVTLTDSNGTITLIVGLGVDFGPAVTTVAGNAGTAGGAASTVTITGTHLRGAFFSGANLTMTGAGTAPTISGAVNTPTYSDTNFSFVVSNAGATPGTYAFTFFVPLATGAWGAYSGTYTVNAAATPLTITSVTPNSLGIPSVNPSAVNITVSGTGFEAGAILTENAANGTFTTLTGSTFVNSTTLKATINVAVGSPTGQIDLKILNPDTTFLVGVGLIGIGVPAASTTAGPAAPVAIAITSLSGSPLIPGQASILHVQGSSTFPLTTGSTVAVTLTGITNPSTALTGTVLSVDATNTATVRVLVPHYAYTTLTAPTTAGGTTLPVANTSGANSGSVIIVDGANSQTLTYGGTTATSFTGVGAGLTVHPAGALVEWPFPVLPGTLSLNNGANTETANVSTAAPVPTSAFTSALTGAPVTTLNVGTYPINAYIPGFGFAAGSTLTFNKDGVTGTVSVVNGNVATLNVTVPATRALLTAETLANPATPAQTAITLSGAPTDIVVGDKITINADTFYAVPETVTVTGISGSVVSFTPALTVNHSVGATITNNTSPQSTSDVVGAILTNGAGQAFVTNSFFTFSTAGTATVAPTPIGAGASAHAETFTLSTATGDNIAADWTVSSTTAGVTFGAVTGVPGATIVAPISVAPGTPANASVPFKLTDGLITYTGTIAIVAGPTVTAITAVGNLQATGTETVGVTGTNLVNGMTCATSDPAVTCATVVNGTDSSTTRTVNVVVGAAALNGTDSITLTDPTTFGAGTLVGAVTVSGQPTATSVSPSSIPQTTTPAITVTGTGFTAAVSGTGGTVCQTLITHPNLSTSANACTVAFVNATTVTVTAYGSWAPGDSIVFTLGNTVSTWMTPAVAVQASPIESGIWVAGTLESAALPAANNGYIAQGSVAVPFKIFGSGFLPGTTVSIPATDGTITVTQVTPDEIYGTATILSTSALGAIPVTALNTSGGSSVAPLITVLVAPAMTAPSTGTPKAVLEGLASTITITGSGFVSGAVVTSSNPALATFGTATVTASANPADLCTGLETSVGVFDTCNTITVKVSPLTYSGSVPIFTGLVVTNPVGAGSVAVANALVINPVPAVTGVYYVPTFTTNAEVVVTGSGFQTGMTASSANPDYKILLVANTGTTFTLLVTTDAQATAGTSSVITLTNPDGGSTTFPLNGGPNPNTVTPTPKATHVSGRAIAGKTVTMYILGTHFYGQPRITSNAGGTRVQVSGDNGKKLTIRVTVKKGVHKGVHTFVLRFANGEQTSVKYSQG